MRSQFESKDARAPLSTGFDLNGWSVASSHPRYSETTTTADGKTSRSSGRRRSSSDDLERRSQSQRRRSGATASEFELDVPVQVQVQVEETVTVEYDPEAFVRESYRTPRVLWGQDWSRATEQSAARGSSRGDSCGTPRGAVQRDANQHQSHLSDGAATGT